MAAKTKLTNYVPDEVAVIFGKPITGFADGTFISVEALEDDYALTTGADGEACRSRTNIRGARMTITLLQSSADNDYLTTLRAADLATPAGASILPFAVKDNSGRTLNAAENAWIVRPPTTVFSRGVEGREWILETNAMIWGVGGN